MIRESNLFANLASGAIRNRNSKNQNILRNNESLRTPANSLEVCIEIVYKDAKRARNAAIAKEIITMEFDNMQKNLFGKMLLDIELPPFKPV